MLIAIFAQVHLFALSGLLVIIKCYTIYSSVCVHLFVSTHLRFFGFFLLKAHISLLLVAVSTDSFPFLSCRMDENYNIVPHGVNFQDPIFIDTAENHRMFASLFQFSNCTPGTQVHTFTPEWEAQEDSRVCRYSDPPRET